MTINFEQHYDDLTRPINWDRSLSRCSNAELRFLEEQAVKYAETSFAGVRAAGEALFLQVQRARALRVAENARMQVQAWAIDELEFPRSESEEPDLSGLPRWSEISTDVGEG